MKLLWSVNFVSLGIGRVRGSSRGIGLEHGPAFFSNYIFVGCN
jgi:hypothetical protein